MKARKKPRQTTKWLYGLPFISGIVYRFTSGMIVLLMATIWRGRFINREKLPKEEPYLLLPNHTSMLDPFWAGACLGRGVRAMASSSLLNTPFLGAYLKMCGCFPKMKYTKDKGSMETLQRLYEDGYVILVFPEGNRCWNGETAPIGAGIGRLIKRLNCKVVYARLNTAYLIKPRWARYSRSLPVEVEYDGPYTYDESLSAEDILADVQEKLTVTPGLSAPGKVKGKKMAVGLPNYLWACPNCFSMDTLAVEGKAKNHVACSSCESTWELDVFSILHGEEDWSVADAFRRIENHFGMPPIASSDRFESEKIALENVNTKLLFIPRGKNKPEVRAEGALQIHQDGLRIMDGEEQIWQAGFKDILGISMEFGNLLHFRVDGELFRLDLGQDSPPKWDHFLRKWRMHTVGAEH